MDRLRVFFQRRVRRTKSLIRVLGTLLLVNWTLSSCVVERPVFCFSSSKVTTETTTSIKTMSKSLAAELGMKIVDKSDRYPSRNIDVSETLGIEISRSDANVVILSSGLLTPTFCYYGSPDSNQMRSLVESIISDLLSFGFELKMENDNLVTSLPGPTQELIRRSIRDESSSGNGR